MPSNWPSLHHFHTTCVMMPYAPSTPCLRHSRGQTRNTSPTCFQVKQAARSQCMPAPSSSFRRFCGTTEKPKPAWFWGPNQGTVPVILRPKSANHSCWFWGPNWETWSQQFWSQTRRNHQAWFWGQTKKPTLLVSLCTMQTAHSITWPLDRLVTEYPTCAWPPPVLCTRSPTPATILVVAHHVTPVTCTSRGKQRSFSTQDNCRVEPLKLLGFKFNLREVNYSSQSNQGTDHLVFQHPMVREANMCP
jgi:hypothetical protein